MEILPTTLSRWNTLAHLRRRSANEYSAECPKCGDYGHIGPGNPDRFRIFTDKSPRGWCRSCGHFEFADSDDSHKLSAFEVAEINMERARLATMERRRVNEKIKRLEEAAEWRGYHKAMLEVDKYRQLWRDAGINDAMQEHWELGYNSQLKYMWGEKEKISPALTIPYWQSNHVINIQSRLLEPASPGDKYRFTAGLPAPLFDPEKDGDEPKGAILLVEGAKKAMVTWLNLGARYRILGAPSKSLSHKQIKSLDGCEPIIMALDPDAHYDSTIPNNIKKLGKERVQIARLPGKIDDLFVHHDAKPDDIDSFLRVARSA